jgi:hypothetical protein
MNDYFIRLLVLLEKNNDYFVTFFLTNLLATNDPDAQWN